jgi:hypothetical protein
MGVEYTQCDNCFETYYEEAVSDVAVERYTVITLCDFCRDEYMIGRPSEFVDPDNFDFVVTKEGEEPKEFDHLCEVREFIIGEHEDDIEPHPGWKFGIKGRELYAPTTPEEAEIQMTELEDKCRLEVWKNMRKNEENTIFTPKREWLEGELASVSAQIVTLQKKKRRLEEILSEPK